MKNRFHPSYHSYTCLSGSRIDLDRTLEFPLDETDGEELVDALSEPPQFFERLSPISVKIGEQEISGRNWTDMALQSYRHFGKIFTNLRDFLKRSAPDALPAGVPAPFMSLSVDPCTLVRLVEHDFETGEDSYAKLMGLFEDGGLAPSVTSPFHPILPLLPSAFDQRMSVRLGLRFFAPILRLYEKHLKRIGEHQMVVSFWAPQCSATEETLAIVHEEFHAFCKRERYQKPHLVLLLDAFNNNEFSLDQLMKTWCGIQLNGAALKDTTVVFRDPGFSEWMMHSHPSIKKMIDRTIAKVSGHLNSQGIDYTWAHFERLEALTWAPRDAEYFEQRMLKLCELGYMPISPDTFVRRKRNGKFGVGKHEPMAVAFHDGHPDQDRLGKENRFGRWRGWALDKNGKACVLGDATFSVRAPHGKKRMQSSPAWKIAWTKTRDACFREISGDPEDLRGGMLGLLASLTGCSAGSKARKNVEDFLIEYSLVFWREHFLLHGMTEADIRLDEIARSTLTSKSSKKLSMAELASAALAAQSYFFLLDACHAYALESHTMDQRALYQNVMMLTLAFVNACAANKYMGRGEESDRLADMVERELFDFASARERYGLESYGVSEEDWERVLRPDAGDADLNVVARAARRTAALHLAPLGYEDRFPARDAEITTNVGHHWNAEVQSPNHEWANPRFCGVQEA